MVHIPKPPRMGDMPKSEPVPEGTYYARVDKAGYKVGTSGKKTPYAEATFTIFGPAEAEEYHGRKFFNNLMLDGDGMWRTRQFLEAIGKDEDYVLDDTDDIVGSECAVVLKVTPEQQDPENPNRTFAAKNEVTRFMPLP